MARTILVTGAGGGIGRTVAQQLLARGDRLIVSALDPEELAGLAAQGATPLAMDVGSDDSVRAAFGSIGALDAVVHCAGIAPLGTVEFTPVTAVATVLNVNTLGTLRVLQNALPPLRAGRGRIVLVSSLWGQVSGPFVSAYAASKHALEALVDAARRECAGQGVSISIVEPGVIKTPMYFGQLGDLDRQMAALTAEERALYGSLYAAHRAVLAKAEKGASLPEDAARVIVTALDARRPRTRYRVGRDAKAVVAMGKLLSDRGLDRVFSMMYAKK